MMIDDQDHFERLGAMEYLEEDPYPELREILTAEYAVLSPEDIEESFETLGLNAEDIEGVLNGIRTVAGLLRPVVSGAVQGGARGGVVGAVSGAIQGAVSGGQRSTQSPAGQQVEPVSPVRPTSGQSLPTTVQPAIASLLQLLQTLASPEVMQALMSMLLNLRGGNAREALARSHIFIGDTLIPDSAIPIALVEAAERFAAELSLAVPGQDEGIPRYLLDAEGEYRINPANPGERVDPVNREHRAAVVLGLLDQAAVEADALEDDDDEEELWIEQDFDMPDTREEDLQDAWDRVESYFTEEEI